MIYDLDNTIFAGRPVKRVIDANGLEWTRTMEIDTETGRIVRQKTDEECRAIIDWEKGEVVLEEVYTAAPIRVEF
jgi:hypothetical protein